MTETPEVREATVGRGAAIFLSDAQLAALGADPDAEKIRYWVENGELQAEAADSESEALWE
jgi:hypothetical protein